ncbi:MAG: sensor histidine kinase [Acidimicrobiales bacterium]
MTDRTLRRVGRWLSALAIVSVPITLLMVTLAGALDQMFTNYTFIDMVVALSYGTLGLVLINSEPRNRLVWFFVALGFSLGLVGIVDGTAELTARAQGVTYAEIDLSGWPPGLARLAGLIHATWLVANMGLPTLGLLLAPDGRLPSRRWRPVAVLTTLALAVGWLMFAAKWPILGSGNIVESYSGAAADVLGSAFIVLVTSIVASLVAIVLRYRRSDAGTRRRLRWLLVGGSLLVLMWFVTAFGPNVAGDRGGDILLIGFYPILALSFGMAIWRDQLFDVDVLISKSVMYLGLLAAITAVFAAVVAVPTLIIGESDEGGPGLLLPIMATAIVAVLFEPVRARMQRWANRLVYGERSTPHEVLSELTARLSETDHDSGTNHLARLLAEGTGADHADVWLQSGETLLRAGSWPVDQPGLSSLPSVQLVDDEFSLVTPVRHGDEELGALSVTKPRSDPVTPADRELVADVAGGAGLMLRNIGLNRELEERAEQVRQSRRRLIAAQDAERHRLERDLHDGAQQQVVALKVKLGIARTLAEREGSGEIADHVVGLADETQAAVDALRAVAHGIYPPLLEAEGLQAALRAIERTSALPIELETLDLERYDRSTEATAYFCVTETLERARMSGAASARVEVAGRNGDLVTEVDLGRIETELDLRSVADRLDAYGGTMTVGRNANGGQRIVSSLHVALGSEPTDHDATRTARGMT